MFFAAGKLLESDAVLDPELLDIAKDDRFDQWSMASVTSSLSPKFCVALYDYKVLVFHTLRFIHMSKLSMKNMVNYWKFLSEFNMHSIFGWIFGYLRSVTFILHTYTVQCTSKKQHL